ncbi:hypothetical protein GXW71_08275 [Roseomonas hellenica]|uniref:Uncharacterized protein n=1 Tax=Plastoroseomonas hellenica TaxID=2687306 RepID=A0ABS5EWR6_9PROT|nr:hypothetical protein [Plastoroseomonas hellenica]MBR0664350.1 hypothetical protein [Plastoroseomonas hellenica]
MAIGRSHIEEGTLALMRVRKVVAPIDGAVTLRVWVDDAGRRVGEVLVPSLAVPGAVLNLTAPEPVDVRSAAATALEAATRRGLDLAVADPDGLWDRVAGSGE